MTEERNIELNCEDVTLSNDVKLDCDKFDCDSREIVRGCPFCSAKQVK